MHGWQFVFEIRVKNWRMQQLKKRILSKKHNLLLSAQQKQRFFMRITREMIVLWLVAACYCFSYSDRCDLWLEDMSNDC